MNQAIQSFILKTVCCILIINVSFCRSCSKLRCAATCYYSNSGFDYGYCENNRCKCSPPVIYLFDGIDRGLSGEYTDNSWENNNYNKNSIARSTSYYEHESETSTTVHTSNGNRNKIWEDIVTIITKEYSFIKKTDLQNLKAKIIGSQSALNYFYVYLKNPLKDALDLMKKKNPDTSTECDELLELLLKQKNLKNTPSLPKTVSSKQVSSQDLPLKEKTSMGKLTTSSPKSLPIKNNDSIGKNPEKNNDKYNTINDKNDNELKEKTKLKRTVVEEEQQKKHEVFYEITEDTVEYSDESNEDLKRNEEKVIDKLQTLPKKNKPKDVVPPIKNKIDDSGSESEYDENEYDDSSEETQSTNNVTPIIVHQ